MATSALAQLPTLDPIKLKNKIEQKDLEQLNQLKLNISEIKLPKELSKTEKAQLKALKEQLNNELSDLLNKQQLEETLHENNKQRKKLESLEKRAKIYREQTILRLEREVLKTLAYLINTYDLQRAKDPMWSAAKKEMRRVFMKIQ